MEKYSAAEEKGIYLNPNGTLAMYFYGTSINFTSATPLTLNAWHFVAETSDGTNATVYIDGVLMRRR
jgi:hypothetical protein